ncbi:unnamed protein product, partial [Clonostachys rosea f. rosea IK726]
MRNTRRQHFTNPTPIDLLPPIQFSEPSSITFAQQNARHADSIASAWRPAAVVIKPPQQANTPPASLFPRACRLTLPLPPEAFPSQKKTAKHLSSYLKEHADQGRLRIYSSLFYRCLETLRPSVVALRDTVGDSSIGLNNLHHAAAIIASGRALTGNVPTDYDEIDFKCFTSGISRFVRKKVPAAGEAYFNDDWRNSGGVAGGWDCELNSDTSHLSGGPQNGWHFQGDQAFDSYEAASKMGVTELSGSRDP